MITGKDLGTNKQRTNTLNSGLDDVRREKNWEDVLRSGNIALTALRNENSSLHTLDEHQLISDSNIFVNQRQFFKLEKNC